MPRAMQTISQSRGCNKTKVTASERMDIRSETSVVRLSTSILCIIGLGIRVDNASIVRWRDVLFQKVAEDVRVRNFFIHLFP